MNKKIDIEGHIADANKHPRGDLISPLNVMFYGAVGNGNTDDSTAFNSAILAMGLNNDIYIPPGIYKISDNITISSGTIFTHGAILSVDVNKTVTITGNMKAGLYQIFTGLGTVSFTGNTTLKEIYPQWWGASGKTNTTTGSITTGSKILVVASATSFKAGHGITIVGAAYKNGANLAHDLFTKIESISGTTLTIRDSAVTSVTGGVVRHNDTEAFQKATTVLIANGGNLFIPPAPYYVGKDPFTTGVGFVMEDVIAITGCSKDITIEGYGAVLIADPSLRFGWFDKTTGVAKNQADGGENVGGAYYGMVYFHTNTGKIRIKGLELDGNDANIQLGGVDSTGDGRQSAGSGIYAGYWGVNSGSILIEDVYAHHQPLDGICLIDFTSENEQRPITILNSNFEYSGRTGIAWCGGNGLTVINCKFNHTGQGAVSSSTRSGIDIEPFDGGAGLGTTKNGLFINCEFLHNLGFEMLAATDGGAVFRNCTFWATANGSCSVWPLAKNIVFEDCKIYGRSYHVYGSLIASEATKFIRCEFEDKVHPTYGGAPATWLIDWTGDCSNVEILDSTITSTRSVPMGTDGGGAPLRDKLKIKRCRFIFKMDALANYTTVLLLHNVYFEDVIFLDDLVGAKTWYSDPLTGVVWGPGNFMKSISIHDFWGFSNEPIPQTLSNVVPLTFANPIAVDMDSSSTFTLTTTGDCTINASGGITGDRKTFIITDNAVGGHTVTFGTGFKTHTLSAQPYTITGISIAGTYVIDPITVEFIYNGSSWGMVTPAYTDKLVIGNDASVAGENVWLHVGQQQVDVWDANNVSVITLKGRGVNTDYLKFAALRFSNYNSGQNAEIVALRGTANNDTLLDFYTTTGGVFHKVFRMLGTGLDVSGNLLIDNQIQSSLAVGTAPFTIVSTTVVSNLNVDLLDGHHASDFLETLPDPLVANGLMAKTSGNLLISNDDYTAQITLADAGSVQIDVTEANDFIFLNAPQGEVIITAVDVTITGDITIDGDVTLKSDNETSSMILTDSTASIGQANAGGAFGLLAGPSGIALSASNIAQTHYTNIYMALPGIGDMTINVTDDLVINAANITINGDGADYLEYTTASKKWTATTSIEAVTFISSITTGNPPLAVTSTTVVSNLNVDMVDGHHASAFLEAVPDPLYVNTIRAKSGQNLALTNDDASAIIYINNDESIELYGDGGVYIDDDLDIAGALTKGSGTFKIDHPILPDTLLYHGFVESPEFGLIYCETVKLDQGKAVVDIDLACRMTQGTFEALCQRPRVLLQNNDTFDRVKVSRLNAGVFTIECENPVDVEIVWFVFAERKDKFIMESGFTDDMGHLKVEVPKDTPLRTSTNTKQQTKRQRKGDS